MDTDRIVKKVMLRAPHHRVWSAISDASQFGSWFGVRFDGPFVAATNVIGRIVPTTVDAEVARSQEAYEGTALEISVDRVEPPRLFSFRWHPYAVERGVDYSKEPTTLVVFELEEVSGGTMLTVTESGFDRIPIERRAKAFASNQQGWTAQMQLIEKYLAMAA
ncbi:MAG TPA: SRPBCC family protein [Candidatus Binataceae bacterium]|nr:SRPBCC family protein [Candidatus Binataceae bacterium]